MIYRASSDFYSKLLTGIILGIFLSVFLLIFFNGAHNHLKWVMIMIGIFLIFVPILCYIFSPKSYKTDGTGVYIQRTVRTIFIPFSNIASVGLLPSNILSGSIRIGGVYGLFGYFGRYQITSVGRIYLAATQLRNFLLIRLKDGNQFVLSPDDLSLKDLIEKNISPY